ncbi:MAG: sodium:solute symporter family protein, partial [Acidobacteria bacterium]|nr:sodium:solute symporter family protein [Acidobacteriota bacterium]
SADLLACETRLNIHLLLLIVYSVLLTAAGLWISRLVRGSGDFFVAGRALSAPLIFSTVLAANIGAGTTVGAAGLAYQEGLSAWWWNGSAAIGSLVLAYWIGPRMWRLASEHGFYTVGDFLEFRYNATVRGVMASFIWVGTLSILAAQLIAGAAVLGVVADIPKPLGVIIGAVVMMVYFVAGGLLTSAWVNLLQLVVLIGGFVIAMPLLYSGVGGGAAFTSMSAPHPGYWDIMYSSGSGMSGWAMLAILTPAFIISPGLLQKAYGARDERAVRLGIGLQGGAQMLFAFIPVFFGLAARAAHLQIDSPNLVLPTVLATQLPAFVGALALAAVFSAEVSTCDAILFMLATSLSKDLYKRFVNPEADDRRVLLVARLAAVAGGLGGIVLAIQLETVIGALGIFYSLLSVSLFVPVVGGLITRRAGASEALASMAAGIVTLFFVTYTTGGRGYGLLNPNVLGLGASALAYVVFMTRKQSSLRPTG